jgi:pyruvate/2-oxoglutarate dehydrogenase complex dihydrolipoamide acyltransferase (E2) component
MIRNYYFQKIPRSRIATFDIFSVGLLRHHVCALLELDVTDSRVKIRELKRNGTKVSFNAWIIKVISKTLEQHPEAAAYLFNKKNLIIYNHINISVIVEKEINGKRVPIPLVIEKTNEKSVSEITQEVENARNKVLSEKDIVLNQQSRSFERFYYLLPGVLRRMIWRFILNHPRIAYGNMGNAVITSVGMIGRLNGWFITKSVHPVSFGIGSVIKKPVVIDDEIKIREILNMTVLLDHDVIDGAPMVRFIKDLTKYFEKGDQLSDR